MIHACITAVIWGRKKYAIQIYHELHNKMLSLKPKKHTKSETFMVIAQCNVKLYKHTTYAQQWKYKEWTKRE